MKYLPIKFHLVYIIATLLFSFFGPRIYVDYNMWLAFIFMAAYLSIVTIGFYIGANFEVKQYRIRSFIRPIKLFKICVLIIIILYGYNLVHLSQTGRLNLNLSTIGDNYSAFYKYYYEKKADNLFNYEIIFLVLSSLPKFIVLVFGFYFFHRLSRFYKGLFICVIVMIILSHTVASGNQKALGDIFIFGVIALTYRAYKLPIKIRRKILFRSSIAMLCLSLFFSFNQYSRLNNDRGGNTIKGLNTLMSQYSQFDEDHAIFKVCGEQIGLGISVFITGYLSGGYYGLSRSMQLPFQWTYGVGNSVALTTIVEKSLGEDIYERTYLSRMEREYNVPGKRAWHTIFPWLASDLTFIGALIVFLPISFVYGLAWKEILIFNNPVSYLIFSLLTILFFFVPANNQIMHGYDYVLITSFTWLYWLVYHNKYNLTNSMHNKDINLRTIKTNFER